MNPVCNITVEGNKAVAVGTISVGEKIDVTVVGISPASVPDYGKESWFEGKSLRLRIVDTQGHDLARFPLKESDSWSVEGDRLSATDVELNTRQLRNVFSCVAYGDKLQFGLILDSGIDHAQYARGKVNIQQWAVASIDDPTVVPDWMEVLAQLDRDLAEIETSKSEAVNAAKESVGAAGVSGRNALAAEASALDAAASKDGAVAAKEAAVLASSRYPRIENGRWLVWQNGGWVDNGPAQGPKGDMPSLDGVVKKDDVVPVEIPDGEKIATIGGKEIKAPKYDDPSDYADISEKAKAGAAHATKTGNPHGTEIGDIDGLTDALGSLDRGIRTAAGAAREALLTASTHESNKSNPHGTTAKQVGAYTTTEVDDKITQNAAHYLTAKVGGEFVQFATHAALAAAKAAHTDDNPQFWYGDDPHTPDKNDYCIVLDDETHGHATTRYMFVGEWPDGLFRYQYTVNETALTQAQWDALNSGANKEKIDAIDEKLDKSYVVAPASDTALSGKAADAYETGKALAGKLDKSGGEVDHTFSIQSKDRFLLFETSYTLDGVKVPAYTFVAGEDENGEKMFGIGFGSYTASDMFAPPGMLCEMIGKELAAVDESGDFVGLASIGIAHAVGDKLTDSDLDSLCTACGISLTNPDGMQKNRCDKLIDLFGQSNSQLAATIRAKVLADGDGEIKAVLFADTAFKTGVATALDEKVAKDKITTLAEASIKDKAMPTEGAAEGSVAARIVALEAGGGGGDMTFVLKYNAEKDVIYFDDGVNA